MTISDFLTIFQSATSQGVLWSLLAIGVYLTFRILDIADLTAEGSFPLGAGIAAISITNGFSPVLATILGFCGGVLAGLISGLLHTKLKIPALLAGIITMTGLYSITNRVMGKAPNISLLGESTIFTWIQDLGLTKVNAVIVVGFIVALLVIAVLYVFFKTEIGLAIRATGDNIDMSEANGINTDNMKMIGYMISNGCISLSGALIAQNNGFADLNSGVGTIVIGLASIIIAEVLLRNKPLLIRLLTIVAGSIIYRFILAIVFEFNVEPSDSKIASAINLEIHPGDFITIIGGNGAGKSTLLNSIAGTHQITSGKVELNGKDITKQSVMKRSKDISRVFQDPKLGTAVRLTVEENLALAMKRGKKRGFASGVKNKDKDYFKKQLSMLNLGLENRLTTEIGLLSGGQRQAITLLMATLERPELILLDEHTAALDPKTSITVMQLTQKLITEQKLTAFMVTHDMEDAIRYGNRLIMLHQGTIVVDIQGADKDQLTVPKLMALFQKNSGAELVDDQLLLQR